VNVELRCEGQFGRRRENKGRALPVKRTGHLGDPELPASSENARSAVSCLTSSLKLTSIEVRVMARLVPEVSADVQREGGRNPVDRDSVCREWPPARPAQRAPTAAGESGRSSASRIAWAVPRGRTITQPLYSRPCEPSNSRLPVRTSGDIPDHAGDLRAHPALRRPAVFKCRNSPWGTL